MEFLITCSILAGVKVCNSLTKLTPDVWGEKRAHTKMEKSAIYNYSAIVSFNRISAKVHSFHFLLNRT